MKQNKEKSAWVKKPTLANVLGELNRQQNINTLIEAKAVPTTTTMTTNIEDSEEKKLYIGNIKHMKAMNQEKQKTKQEIKHKN